MTRFLAVIGLALALLIGAAPAQAGHRCCEPSYDYCPPRDCCRQKVCYPVYRWVTRKVFDGYETDCYGCTRPTYRTVRVKVYAGKRCVWRNSSASYPSRYDDDAYSPPEYTGEDDAFPNYRGN